MEFAPITRGVVNIQKYKKDIVGFGSYLSENFPIGSSVVVDPFTLELDLEGSLLAVIHRMRVTHALRAGNKRRQGSEY